MNARAWGTVVLSAACLLGSCRAGERPFLIVQFCLNGNEEVAELRAVATSIAREYRMRFIDNSAGTQDFADSEPLANKVLGKSKPIIDFEVERSDGLGFGVGNLGLPANQVALGFSKGAERSDTDRFYRRVLSTLKAKWKLYKVPDGRGALPIKCETATSSPKTG